MDGRPDPERDEVFENGRLVDALARDLVDDDIPAFTARLAEIPNWWTYAITPSPENVGGGLFGRALAVASYEMVEMMIDNWPDLIDDFTILAAAHNGRFRIVLKLVGLGVDVTARDYMGHNVIMKIFFYMYLNPQIDNVRRAFEFFCDLRTHPDLQDQNPAQTQRQGDEYAEMGDLEMLQHYVIGNMEMATVDNSQSIAFLRQQIPLVPPLGLTSVKSADKAM